MIFDVMLCAYIAGLETFSKQLDEYIKWQRPDGYGRALQSAGRAMRGFRDADDRRNGGDIASADATIANALLALQERYLLCPYGHVTPYPASAQERFRLSTALYLS